MTMTILQTAINEETQQPIIQSPQAGCRYFMPWIPNHNEGEVNIGMSIFLIDVDVSCGTINYYMVEDLLDHHTEEAQLGHLTTFLTQVFTSMVSGPETDLGTPPTTTCSPI